MLDHVIVTYRKKLHYNKWSLEQSSSLLILFITENICKLCNYATDDKNYISE